MTVLTQVLLDCVTKHDRNVMIACCFVSLDSFHTVCHVACMYNAIAMDSHADPFNVDPVHHVH